MRPHNGIYSLNQKKIDHYTKDAHCPSCNLDIRHRLSFYYLSKDLKKNQNISVLHFAPEYKIYKIFKGLKLKKYIAADVEIDNFDDAVYINATDIPYSNSSFDFVIFNHILQFIQNSAPSSFR